MRLTGASECHLTYSTSVHPAETWREVHAALQRHVPLIKAKVAPNSEFGVGLRLSALAAFELYDPANLEELRGFLSDEGLYVFTLDGHAFGRRGVMPDSRWGPGFPDWADLRRLAYSNVLADLLAGLLPDDQLYGSISTVPVGNKGTINQSDLSLIVRNLVRYAAYLVYLRNRTGNTITIALEMTPGCLLETTSDAIHFFEHHLLSQPARVHFATVTGLVGDAAEEALRTHVGLCLDLSHIAAQFEKPSVCIRALDQAGIRIAKAQISAALRITDAAEATTLLDSASEDTPTPVIEQRGESIAHYADLHAAFEQPVETHERYEWRIDCHAPASRARVGACSTTQAFARDFLRLQRDHAVTAHLEVEADSCGDTHSAEQERELCANIAREIQWVCKQLNASPAPSGTGSKSRRKAGGKGSLHTAS